MVSIYHKNWQFEINEYFFCCVLFVVGWWLLTSIAVAIATQINLRPHRSFPQSVNLVRFLFLHIFSTNFAS